MKIIDLFWLIVAAILMALRAVPASATGTETVAMLKSQTQELMDAVTDGKADVWQRYLADDSLYAAETITRRPAFRHARDERLQSTDYGIKAFCDVPGISPQRLVGALASEHHLSRLPNDAAQQAK